MCGVCWLNYSENNDAQDQPQRDRSRWRLRYAPVSRYARGIQAADAGFRQADDLLPPDHADAGGHTGNFDHLHPAGYASFRATPGRRLAMGPATVLCGTGLARWFGSSLYYWRTLLERQRQCTRARRQYFLWP